MDVTNSLNHYYLIVLLAGLSDKKKASQALPLLDRVRRREGKARS